MSTIKLYDFDYENVTTISEMLLSNDADNINLGISIIEEQFPQSFYLNALGFYMVDTLLKSEKWFLHTSYDTPPHSKYKIKLNNSTYVYRNG